MTIQSFTQRITLMTAAGVAAATLVEAISSSLGKRDTAHIVEYHRPESDRVMVYFPALATDAKLSAVNFLPFFELDSVLLVDYPRTGISRQATFTLLEQMLERYRGKQLMIYAVSMGSGVALNFRRYMKSSERMKGWFPHVRFIFHSPVTAAADVNWNMRAISYLGFVFRGGIVSRYACGFIVNNLLIRAASGHGSAWFLDKMQQLKSALTDIPMRLLASELRSVHYGRRGRPGEFADDSALILYGTMEDVVNQKTPERLAKAFGRAQIMSDNFVGHADIVQAVSSGSFAKALQMCLANF